MNEARKQIREAARRLDQLDRRNSSGLWVVDPSQPTDLDAARVQSEAELPPAGEGGRIVLVRPERNSRNE
jgi:hypothetical protein